MKTNRRKRRAAAASDHEQRQRRAGGFADGLTSFRELARERGVSPSELLERALQIGDDARFPTPVCLLPAELEVYAAGHSLPDEVRAHIPGCVYCTSLLEISRPVERYEQIFLENVEVAREATVSVPKRTLLSRVLSRVARKTRRQLHSPVG